MKLKNPLKEHGWGQQVVRFYDPDSHIIEVGESMKTVVHRFRNLKLYGAFDEERLVDILCCI